MKEETTIAYRLAEKYHKGQTRRGGEPYFEGHLIPVAKKVWDKYSDEKLKSVGLLHDSIEDCDITHHDLLDEGISSEVVAAIVAITKVNGEPYVDYLQRVKNNEMARKVKIVDMLHNLSSDPTDKQIVKYAKGLQYLMED